MEQLRWKQGILSSFGSALFIVLRVKLWILKCSLLETNIIRGHIFMMEVGGYYFLSPSAIQWSLEQTDEIATIKQVGYHAKLTAIQAGETIVKLQFLLQHFVPQSNGEYSIASDTITQSATVSVTIVQGSGTTGGSNQNFPDAIFEETLPGATVESGGTSSNTTQMNQMIQRARLFQFLVLILQQTREILLQIKRLHKVSGRIKLFCWQLQIISGRPEA